MVDDSPCTGVCRMEGTRCISCNRTYDDLEQWYTMSREARLERMKQLKAEHGR
jgi:predicted Fe-S protein YdhL (DUF1289 family)